MDAQLFAKIIVNMFEMTKFHRRLIYLLKSVFGTLRRFYKHIDCKVKMKGKMQYKKRTKTIYIFKEVVIPLNRLFITVEYGKAPANTPFGVLGIKT
jgi:ribosomal protein S3